jgi:MFS family permease
LAPNSAFAFAAVFVLGIGSTWTLTTAMAHFATASHARRGASLSVFAGSLLTGQAIGPAVGGWLGAAYDWRIALGVGAAVAFVVGIPFLIRGGARTENTVTRSATVAPVTPPRVSRLVFPVLYLLPAVQFSVGAAMVQTLVPLVADEQFGIGPALVGGALAVAGGSRLAAALVSGAIIDKISRRAALIPGVVLQVIGVAAFAFGGTVAWWWISILLVSLGSIGVNTGSAVIADLSAGGGLGRRLGAFRFTGDSAFMVAPLLTGWLFDVHGRMVSMLPLLAFTAAVAIAAVLVVPETHPSVYDRLETPTEPGNTE